VSGTQRTVTPAAGTAAAASATTTATAVREPA
jgi:hypothetical protein